MSLRDRLHVELTAAMRSREALRRDTLRMAENAIYNAEKRDRRTYSDDEVAAVFAHEVKTRRESVEAFAKGRRPDLVAKEEAEIEILQAFLPAQLTDDELAALVHAAVEATGATSARDLGRVMGWLSPKTRGRADGRRVAELVARVLAGVDLAGHASDHGRNGTAGAA